MIAVVAATRFGRERLLSVDKDSATSSAYPTQKSQPASAGTDPHAQALDLQPYRAYCNIFPLHSDDNGPVAGPILDKLGTFMAQPVKAARATGRHGVRADPQLCPNLYGTTYFGGAHGSGTVFELKT
jgi:hypothetical protein